MGVPDFQSLMLPLMEICADSDQEVQSYVNKLANKFNLTEEERSQTIPSGKQTVIKNRAQWAATYLSKAGLLKRPKTGVIAITEAGLGVLKTNPDRIDINYLMNFESFRKFKTRRNQANDSNDKAEQSTDEATPEDLISKAFENYEQTTKDEILELILGCSPAFFEILIIDLFKSMGYGGKGKSTHIGKSGDGGIDGIIDEDPLGLEKIYLQAKRYAPENKINIDQIRSFSGSLHEQGARKGIFVTTSSFVSSAYEYADRNPQSIILIDGEQLTQLMYQYDVGVRTVDTIRLKKPDADYFEEV